MKQDQLYRRLKKISDTTEIEKGTIETGEDDYTYIWVKYATNDGLNQIKQIAEASGWTVTILDNKTAELIKPKEKEAPYDPGDGTKTPLSKQGHRNVQRKEML